MSNQTLASDWLSLWANLPGFYWAINAQDQLMAMSNSYLALLGEDAPPLMGKDIYSLLVHTPFARLVNKPNPLKNILEKVRHTGQQQILSSQEIVNHTGQRQVFNLVFIPISDEHGRVTHILHQAREVPQEVQLAASPADHHAMRSVMGTLGEAVWTTNAAGMFNEDAPKWRAFTGQTYDEWKGVGWLKAVHPDDMSALKESWHQSVKTGARIEVTFRLRHLSGKWCWTVARGIPLQDAAGAVYAWMGMNLIVSNQGQAADLFSELNIYRNIAVNMPNGAVFIIDRDFRYRLAEGNAYKEKSAFFGNIEGKTIWEVLDVKTANAYECYLKKALAGEPFRHEHNSQGSYYISHGTPMYNEQGEIDAVLAVSYDITERKNAEVALRQSEEHLQLILESARDYAIFTLDKHLQITDWNAGAEQMLGYSKAEVLGKKGDIIFVPEDRKTEPEHEVRVATENGRFENERWHLRKDGSLFWGSGFTVPMRDGEGSNIRGFLKIMRDNTQRQLMEASLRQAKEEAEQAARAKEDFLVHMSHEIRTPLNAVVGLTSLLLQQNPQPQQLENLQTLRFSAQNLMSLVNDILDFNKIRAGKVTVEPTDINLRELFHSLQKAHQPRCQDQENELVFHIDQAIPDMMHTDALKLSQMMHNLIGNAVKFTHQGVITVEVSLNRQQHKQYWVDFSVSDTGIGIPAEKLAGIFDAFTQANNATLQQYGGTGLGLSITKMLLELMESQVQVESQQGKGSRFFFTLKMEEGTSTQGSSDEKLLQQDSQQALQDVRLLLVEDSAINRMILLQLLADWWQLVPDEATDGQQAVEMARQKSYDLILMDVRMPVMDGYEATRLIRSFPDASYRKVPIIALTADTEGELKKRPEATLFTDVVTKPFDPLFLQDLRHKIHRHTIGKRTQKNSSPVLPAVKMNTRQVEKMFRGDAKVISEFYEKVLTELTGFRENFATALMQREQHTLQNLVHKCAMLLNILALNELKKLLHQSMELVDQEAPQDQLEQLHQKTETMIEQVLVALKKQMHQLSLGLFPETTPQI